MWKIVRMRCNFGASRYGGLLCDLNVVNQVNVNVIVGSTCGFVEPKLNHTKGLHLKLLGLIFSHAAT